MKAFNQLQIRPTSRFNDSDLEKEGNKNTKFADLIIDGESLFYKLKKYDMVPSLGWGTEKHQRQMIEYFLLNELHTTLYYRYPILVCPWCGDEECGFISVSIDREGDQVTWSNFKVEPSNRPIDIGPYYFKWDQYESVIRSTYGITGTE